jgi:DNA-binding PadR family transcriptional regulator
MIQDKPLHGYGIIMKIKQEYHVYFGPSTIYPELAKLESEGYAVKQWNMTGERPRLEYTITNEGRHELTDTGNILREITLIQR